MYRHELSRYVLRLVLVAGVAGLVSKFHLVAAQGYADVMAPEDSGLVVAAQDYEDAAAEVSPDIAVAAAELYASIPLTSRRMWETYGGFCGETTVQQIAAANGIWIGQRQARTLRGASFTSQDLLLGLSKTAPDSAEGLLDLLGFSYALRVAATVSTSTTSLKDHMKWIKANILSGRGVALGVSARGETETEYDHIIPAYGVKYTDSTMYSPTDVLTLTDDFLNVYQRSMDVTKKPFFDSENPTTGCRIAVNPGGGCINTDNNNYAVAIGGLKEASSSSRLYQPLQLRITAWVGDSTPATAEPYNKNTAAKYELKATGCAAAGQAFTLFRFVGYTSFVTLTGTGRSAVGVPPTSLAQLKTRCSTYPNACKSKSFTMGATTTGLLTDVTTGFGVIYSNSVVYFVCVRGV